MSFEADEIIDSQAKLRAILKEPDQALLNQDLDHVNEVARQFIALAPFLIITSKGPDGLMDTSPKGDPRGFVKVWDEKTLIIPIRAGNNRADTLENILHDPAVGLLFLIPHHTTTLRIAGQAKIIQDKTMQKRLAVNGREPQLALAITVQQAFMHCPQCFVRSNLWTEKPDATPAAPPNLLDWEKAAERKQLT